MTTNDRGRFGSRLGVVLASAGSAVGLGNVWRFPTEVGRNGGAAFIVIYLLFVFLLAMPVMVAEFVIGRRGKANTVDAYRRLAPGRPWFVAGYLGVLTSVLMLSFYCVVAGWTLHYTVASLTLDLSGRGDYGGLFANFVAGTWWPIVFLALFMLITHVVVARGVERGIERVSKVLMPVLLVIIAVLVCYSLTMPGAEAGLRFLLKPDFSKVTGGVVLSAVGQAFFSLSVGQGAMVTYASYFGRDTRLVSSAFSVCVIDSAIAILSGFFIFPAVFSVGNVPPDAGAGLVFITLPQMFDTAFAGIPVVGYIFSGLFYVLLLVAALTSAIAMHEIITAFIRERFSLPRHCAAAVVTGICTALGVACSLSFGAWRAVKVAGMGFFDLFEFLTAKIMMPLGGMLITLFVGWQMPLPVVEAELSNGGKLRVRCVRLLVLLMRWVTPIGVVMVFINEMIN